MKKMFFSLGVLLVISGIGFVREAHGQELQGQDLQGQDLPRLAVTEFTPNVHTEKARADSVTVRNLVESRMVGTGKYQIVTRTEIDQLLSNQRIAVSDISSAENVQKLQLQNISYIVTGSVDAMGSDYAVTVKILDVSTGRFSHSASDFMGGGSRELYTGVNTLTGNFVKGMSSQDGQVAQAGLQRPGSGPSAAGIGIEVSAVLGGTLYFHDEEIAALWDNDTYTIPIERPGTYRIRMVFGNGGEISRDVTITSRGVVKETFPAVGDTGPGGGLVFYDKGGYSDGWRFLEAAPASAEFTVAWGLYEIAVSGTNTGIGTGKRNTEIIAGRGGAAAQRCAALNTGGCRDWFLPGKDELNLMYQNLKRKGLGEFSDSLYWYWSSSEYDNNNAWIQRFSDGRQGNYGVKNLPYSVRAVRAF
ncbi:MAG: DUF1566 domain-containing protein [Treponema sp.]|jgi:hypothetical protein|nr:DUF1566 domain-containing protein [Treponema sp.]